MRIGRVLLLLAVLAVTGASRLASAQEATVAAATSDDNFDATTMADFIGNGYIVTPGVIAHVRAGMETGATDNVFFTAPGQGMVGAAMLKETAVLQIGSEHPSMEELGELSDKSPAEITPKTVDAQLGLRLSYLEFFGASPGITGQDRLQVTANGSVVANADKPVAFIANETFVRDPQSPQFESPSTLNRDDNHLGVGLRLHADSSNHYDTIYYDNWVSVFENGGWSLPDRLNQTVGIQHQYQWQPKTALFADVSYGFFGPIGEQMPFMDELVKSKSQPFRAIVGFAHGFGGQASEEESSPVTIKAHVGYAHASYQEGEGYSSPVGGAELGFRWTDTGRVLLQYDYDHYDSFNANFYRDQLYSLKLVQKLAFVIVDGGPEVRLREYEGIPSVFGPPTRDDTVVGVHARAQMTFADRYTLSAEYMLFYDHTDYRQIDYDSVGDVIGMSNPSFTRNQFMVGLWAAY